MSGTDPLRVAVLGVGRIGSMHADVVAHDVPGATLVGVADAMPEMAEVVAAKLGVPAVDIDKVLERDDVDAVAICSSTDTHVDLMIDAAQAGKAILCEKPISLDLPEVDRGLGRSRGGRRAADDWLQPPVRSRPPCLCARPSRRARSGSPTSSASPAATPAHRRSTMCGCRAGSSST